MLGVVCTGEDDLVASERVMLERKARARKILLHTLGVERVPDEMGEARWRETRFRDLNAPLQARKVLQDTLVLKASTSCGGREEEAPNEEKKLIRATRAIWTYESEQGPPHPVRDHNGTSPQTETAWLSAYLEVGRQTGDWEPPGVQEQHVEEMEILEAPTDGGRRPGRRASRPPDQVACRELKENNASSSLAVERPGSRKQGGKRRVARGKVRVVEERKSREQGRGGVGAVDWAHPPVDKLLQLEMMYLQALQSALWAKSGRLQGQGEVDGGAEEADEVELRACKTRVAALEQIYQQQLHDAQCLRSNSAPTNPALSSPAPPTSVLNLNPQS